MSDVAEVDQYAGPIPVVSALEAEITNTARTDRHVLIVGDAGAGRRIAAEQIHQRSRRASAPIVSLICGNVPDALLASELFGHLRGSFPGAFRDKPGLLDLAAGGTLFLDNVGVMSPRVQDALRRFLDTGHVTRVGATRPHNRVDVRVIAGAGSDLGAAVASGVFGRRLFDRLNDLALVRGSGFFGPVPE